VDGGVLADRFLERRRLGLKRFGTLCKRNGHGRDFGGRRFRYIAPVEKSVGVVDLVKTCDLPESISSNLRV
jgi:hypothetical protein